MNNPAQGMTQQQLIQQYHQNFHPAQGMTQGMTQQQLSNMANQQFTQQYHQNFQQMGLNQIYQIYSGRSQLWPQEDWVFNGRAYDITDFAEVVYGDTPERTAFLLKYTKEK